MELEIVYERTSKFLHPMKLIKTPRKLIVEFKSIGKSIPTVLDSEFITRDSKRRLSFFEF